MLAATLTAPARLRFLESFLSPTAGDDVIRAAFSRQKIHRDHRELQTRSALQKQHVIVVRNAKQLSQAGFSAIENFVKRL